MARQQGSLFLQEEILLLALRDEEGTVAADHTFRFALGGAMLAELLLAKRIAIDEGKSAHEESGVGGWLSRVFSERNLVDLVSDAPLGDPLLDECLERIATAKRRASIKTWVTRFSNVSKLQHRIAEGLCERRVLRADEGTILLIFKRKIYPELDPKPERALIERLRKAIFTEVREIDPRTVILLSLADSAKLLRVPFDRKKLRERRKRIERITDGDLMGKATKEAIQAAQAAMTAAAIVPIMGATAATH
jgi:hypothetical protein